MRLTLGRALLGPLRVASPPVILAAVDVPRDRNDFAEPGGAVLRSMFVCP
jgi:hypothetical protein